MSTPPDKNFLSYSGDNQGNIWRNGELVVSGPRSGVVYIDVGDVVPDNDSYADSLKISGVYNAIFNVGRIVGSREDCIDINHSHGISVNVKSLEPKGKYVATIKGGSNDITITADAQIGHGSETDYDLGNFTEASQDKTTRVVITVLHGSAAGYDSTPVVRVINADFPITNGLKIVKPWWGYWPFWAIYCTLRIHGIIPA